MANREVAESLVSAAEGLRRRQQVQYKEKHKIISLLSVCLSVCHSLSREERPT